MLRMDKNELKMHLAAGRYFGRASTCGTKRVFTDLHDASKAADNLNKSSKKRHDVEPYPCYWCSDRFPDSDELDFVHLNWHIGREMTTEERKLFSSPEAMTMLSMETIQVSQTEPMFVALIGIQGLRVHNRSQCQGQPCCIHNPSSHHMIDWKLNWRADRRIMERICPHGIGHPDPDDSNFRKTRPYYDSGVHGCDGCCAR